MVIVINITDVRDSIYRQFNAAKN